VRADRGNLGCSPSNTREEEHQADPETNTLRQLLIYPQIAPIPYCC
jgi:hypothetical protein